MAKIRLPKELLKRLLVVPPVVIGAVLLVVLFQSRKDPPRRPAEEVARPVRTVSVLRTDVVPRTIGYGTAEPEKVWKAIAQISGEVVEIDPALKNGAIYRGTVDLLKIDRTRYDLAVREADARIAELRAQLTELGTTESNTAALLEIEKRTEKLATDDLVRTKTLFDEGKASQVELDQRELEVLRRRTGVRSLQNTTSLIPSQRDALTAKIAVQQAQLESAQLDVESAAIRTPFNCRISNVDIELGQYAQVGQVLVEADSTDVTEVTTQLQINRLRNLILHQPGMAQLEQDGNVDVTKILTLDATVRLREGAVVTEWPGRFAGLADTIDPQTRTVGVIVAVDGTYRQAEPGRRTPLIKGMFVEVEIRGIVIADALVIPAMALQGDSVFVVDDNRRLARVPVETRFVQGDFAVIDSGLAEGAEVLVTDPVPAVVGMLLEPQRDVDLERRIAAAAAGEGDVK